MLVKYKEELTRPVEEAMDFMRKIESQLTLLSNGHARLITSGMFMIFKNDVYTFI